MLERKYNVLIDGAVVAGNVDTEIALILVKGIFEEYCNDYGIEVAIKPIPNIKENSNE